MYIVNFSTVHAATQSNGVSLQIGLKKSAKYPINIVPFGL